MVFNSAPRKIYMALLLTFFFIYYCSLSWVDANTLPNEVDLLKVMVVEKLRLDRLMSECLLRLEWTEIRLSRSGDQLRA